MKCKCGLAAGPTGLCTDCFLGADVSLVRRSAYWSIHWKLPTGTVREDQCDSPQMLADRIVHAAACAVGDIIVRYNPAS